MQTNSENGIYNNFSSFFRKSLIVLLISVSTSVLVLASVGCNSKNYDVQIVQKQDEVKTRDGLDPLTRGKIRREILKDTKENIAYWLAGDSSKYKQVFTEDLLDKYEKQLEKLNKKGQKKIRIHEDQKLEVVELFGKDIANVKYKFVDKSYFISSSTGKIVKPSQNKESEILIEVKKISNRWKIKAMIGASESTL